MIQRTIAHQRQKIRIARLARTLICAAFCSGLVQGCNSPKSATADGGVGTRSSKNFSPAQPSSSLATIEGTVRAIGKIPALAPRNTSEATQKICGAQIADRTLVVGDAGALANAVVSWADAPAIPLGDAESLEPPVMDQRRCEYLPPVLAVRAGAQIEIRNSDPLLHNVHAKNSASLFNFAMPIQGFKVRKQLPRSAMTIQLSCDVHPWMHAVIRTFEHPYFAVTDATGRYRLERIPTGKQKLVFWHERFPEKRIEIDALPSKPTRADLEWSASELQL